MPAQIDMATALELTLESEQEAKFQALKNLQSKKIKYLMTSIDSKDKELARLKVLGKDNRRTQMIQALKNKLRDQELVSDVAKEELSRRNEMTVDEVNAYIMRKTLGGPKRFRPLSREELETKISELERKLKRVGDGPSRNAGSNQQGTNASLSSNNNFSRVGNEISMSEGNGDLNTMAKLADELQNLRILMDSKDATIEQQKEDVSRLRARNSELRITDEELDFQDRNYRELKTAYDQISKDLEELSNKFSSSSEENMLLRGELANEHEVSRAEVDGLQELCQKTLKQNNSLLKSMAALEHDLEKAMADLTSAGSAGTSNVASQLAHSNALAVLESKIFRLNEKLKLSEEKNQDLVTENAQINILKDTLRERSNAIKELKRNLEEREKSRGSAPNDSGDEMRLKIVDLMSENKTLKQALAAATVGVRAGSDRTGK